MADDQQELIELIEFLTNPRDDVRKAASELVEGLTGSLQGIEKLLGEADRLLPALLRLLGDDRAISKSALTSLVNLTQKEEVVAQLVKLKVVARIMDYLRGDVSAHAQLLVMLLANVTTNDSACLDLLQLDTKALAGLNVAVLLKRFLDSSSTAEEDPYEHAALVLTNITRLPEGRKLLLEPGRDALLSLAGQLGSRSRLRRSGSATLIRNCCFRAEEDGTLEAILGDTALLEAVLEVLCGVTRPKEADDDVRVALSESLEMLVSTERGKDLLWHLKAPEMLRKGYETEENPEVCSSMERMAHMFMSDASAAPEPEMEPEEEQQALEEGPS